MADDQQAAEMPQQEQAGAGEVYTFARPVLFEGAEYKQITVDFDKLTGEDILSSERQYRADQSRNGGGSLAPEMDKAYQAIIVAKASGVHAGLIRAASAKDFTRLTLRARNFLLL
ncbi:phage tail assembly protein [Cohnella sp. GCM10012308]|uniref:phage tail assembly protein n=1 Tax=Cohnella sp. GCM10012308 TaxID=3317329 RepID=UPI00361F92D3